MIFVTSLQLPLSQTEVRFLADAAGRRGKLFLVLDKRDLVSGRDAGAVTEYVRRFLREDLGLGEPRLFGLSALKALEDTVQCDGEALSGSGLAPLPRRAHGFLAERRADTAVPA